jgi:hypothetical protein
MGCCSVCGSPISDVADRCSTCGTDAGAPNVRAAQEPAEISALENRFEDALARADAHGTRQETDDFMRALERSSAVVNCELPFLRDFVTRSTTLFANYHRGVQAEVRKAAEGGLDRDRVIADAVMFGSYSEKIRFAALSLTNTGLSSYGPYSLKLRDVAVAKRASLLEENSFSFIQHHNLSVKIPIPFGYRSTWAERAKLAIAKLVDLIAVGMDEIDFQSLLLVDSGNRVTDNFIEIHIFGTFDREAIDSVSGPKLKKRSRDVAIWEVVKETLKVLKRSCHEQ